MIGRGRSKKWGLARFLPFEKAPVPLSVPEMALVAAEKPARPLYFGALGSYYFPRAEAMLQSREGEREYANPMPPPDVLSGYHQLGRARR